MATTPELGRFELGAIVLTPGASTAVPYDDFFRSLGRHMAGDWGDLDEHDWQVNEAAVENGGRILSRYVTRQGIVFWVITEHDRSATTFLLPGEY